MLPLNPLYIFKTQTFLMFESLTLVLIQNTMIEVYSSGEKEVREKVGGSWVVVEGWHGSLHHSHF